MWYRGRAIFNCLILRLGYAVDFLATLDLKNYFAVTGNTNTMAFSSAAIYAGTSFIVVGGEAMENPIGDTLSGGSLGGALNTILNQDLLVMDQSPQPESSLSVNDAVRIQFNRILDYNQVTQAGDSIITVTLDGVPISGFVSQQVNNDGSELIFRPASPLEEARQYRLSVSADLSDLHGQSLSETYHFRFTTVSSTQPIIDDINPRIGSWRGGEAITLRGSGFSSDSVIRIGGIEVAAANITAIADDELRFNLPGLAQSPSANALVGIEVRNGELYDLAHGALTYIADPEISAIGRYDRVDRTLHTSQKRLTFNAGQYIGISGNGLGSRTRVRINGQEVSDLRVESAGVN